MSRNPNLHRPPSESTKQNLSRVPWENGVVIWIGEQLPKRLAAVCPDYQPTGGGRLVIITEIDFRDQASSCSSSACSLQFLYGDFCHRTNKSQSASSSACPTTTSSFPFSFCPPNTTTTTITYRILVHRYPSKVILLKGFWPHPEPPPLVQCNGSRTPVILLQRFCIFSPPSLLLLAQFP